MDDTPPWEQPAQHADKPKPSDKPGKISEDEQAALSAQMDESQKAPAPVYEHPPIDLLDMPKGGSKGNVQAELTENSQRLIDTLESFGIEAQIDVYKRQVEAGPLPPTDHMMELMSATARIAP